MQQLYKRLILEQPKLRLYQLTKNIAAKLAPHISFALIDLVVVFDKYILLSPILAVLDHASTADSCYGTQNNQ